MSKNISSLLSTAALLQCAIGLAATEPTTPSLQHQIAQAKPGAAIIVPEGTWTDPLVIDKPVTLRGLDREKCILKSTSDTPLIWVKAREQVTLENLTLIWQRATSTRPEQPPCAVLTEDATVRLHRCQLTAPSGNARCPSAIIAMGFSELQLTECSLQGFEFTVQIFEGTQATVSDCLLVNPGHCGITVGRNAEGKVTRTIVTGSGYHGIRCTGGTLVAEDNLIVRNKNRGFYLGNRTGKGTLRNNLILENGTGISAFAGADYTITRNIMANCDFAGLDTRDTCRIRVSNNVITGNARGIAVFDEASTRQFTIERNTFWENETESQNIDLPSVSLRLNPRFRDTSNGDYALTSQEPDAADQGLTNPEIIRSLWRQYTALTEETAAD